MLIQYWKIIFKQCLDNIHANRVLICDIYPDQHLCTIYFCCMGIQKLSLLDPAPKNGGHFQLKTAHDPVQ